MLNGSQLQVLPTLCKVPMVTIFVDIYILVAISISSPHPLHFRFLYDKVDLNVQYK